MTFTKKTAVKILRHYHKSIPKTLKSIKSKAKSIVSGKFCRCIKHVKKSVKNEGHAIAICTKNIINKSLKLKRGRFRCR